MWYKIYNKDSLWRYICIDVTSKFIRALHNYTSTLPLLSSLSTPFIWNPVTQHRGMKLNDIITWKHCHPVHRGKEGRMPKHTYIHVYKSVIAVVHIRTYNTSICIYVHACIQGSIHTTHLYMPAYTNIIRYTYICIYGQI